MNYKLREYPETPGYFEIYTSEGEQVGEMGLDKELPEHVAEIRRMLEKPFVVYCAWCLGHSGQLTAIGYSEVEGSTGICPACLKLELFKIRSIKQKEGRDKP